MAEGTSKTTTDHDEIRRWAEERGGRPATVRGTEDGGVGVLRIWFPDVGAGEEELQEIDWDEFFDKFEDQGLAMLYQEETAEGEVSRFVKFVSR
ncbi:MAG TPA: hypothetical protein VHF25_05320 [Nitriliruptorales bacterium]|nr:hypothetical protein [Nitriliruptorales bacterium]